MAILLHIEVENARSRARSRRRFTTAWNPQKRKRRPPK
jgi:hypothetical protein